MLLFGKKYYLTVLKKAELCRTPQMSKKTFIFKMSDNIMLLAVNSLTKNNHVRI